MISLVSNACRSRKLSVPFRETQSTVLLYSSSLLFLISPITTVTLAYFMILQFSKICYGALVYRMNKTPDTAHPCGAPVFIVMVEDTSDSVRMYCCLFVRKFRINT